MDWGQTLVILTPLVTFMGFIYNEMRRSSAEAKEEINVIKRSNAEAREEIKEWRIETREEIKEWRAETRAETAEISKKSEQEIAELRKGFQDEMRIQSSRSDKLYEMFIALLEKQQPKTHP